MLDDNDIKDHWNYIDITSISGDLLLAGHGDDEEIKKYKNDLWSNCARDRWTKKIHDWRL